MWDGGGQAGILEALMFLREARRCVNFSSDLTTESVRPINFVLFLKCCSSVEHHWSPVLVYAEQIWDRGQGDFKDTGAQKTLLL